MYIILRRNVPFWHIGSLQQNKFFFPCSALLGEGGGNLPLPSHRRAPFPVHCVGRTALFSARCRSVLGVCAARKDVAPVMPTVLASLITRRNYPPGPLGSIRFSFTFFCRHCNLFSPFSGEKYLPYDIFSAVPLRKVVSAIDAALSSNYLTGI